MAPDGLPIFQFAYVVDDLASAAENWASTMGAGPFFVAAHHRADRFLYRGQPIEADVSYAFGYSGKRATSTVAPRSAASWSCTR